MRGRRNCTGVSHLHRRWTNWVESEETFVPETWEEDRGIEETVSGTSKAGDQVEQLEDEIQGLFRDNLANGNWLSSNKICREV